MSFRNRLLALSVTLLTGSLLALYFLLSSVFLDEFRQVEERDVRQKMEKLRSVIDFELRSLANKTGDWANWTDSWNYARGTNPGFPDANISMTTFTELGIDTLAFIGKDGQMVHVRAADREAGREVAPPSAFTKPLEGGSPLLLHSNPDRDELHGLLMLQEGPMFIAARAILDSEGSGDPAGTLLFGQFIRPPEIELLEQMSHMSIRIFRTDADDLPDSVSSSLSRLQRQDDIVVSPVDEGGILGTFALADVYGNRALVVQGNLQRPIYAQAKEARLFVLYALCLVGLTLTVFILVLIRWLSRSWDQHHQSEERVRHLAFHDQLTGLPNRYLFNDRVKMAIHQARRSEYGLAALFVDLDQFKNVNDTLGHEVGDALLRQVAERLSGQLRSADSVGRPGGDEFLILLHNVDSPAKAKTAADRLFTVLREPFRIDHHEFHISASIGIALFPTDGEDADTLFRNADIAMYHAKEEGRNNSQLFNAEMNRHMVEVLDTKNRLIRALESDELLLHYQPQISLTDGRLVGLEALVRWQDPERGMIPPGKFIPVAEETGLIVSVGSWVLKAACQQAAKWAATGIGPLRIGVNLSARQFRGTLLAETVRLHLTEAGIDPKWLDLEVTESVAVQGSEFVRKTLEDLRGLGISVSLDDFGTGYSSLSYLRSFPFDVVKMDRSFVSQICSSGVDRSLVSGIVSLAHGLGLKVVAEGVENQRQLSYLRHIGCDTVQGYVLSRPIPADQVEQFLRNRQWVLPEDEACEDAAAPGS
jgi:diguanylate cyclase (GGDEF)-like protein